MGNADAAGLLLTRQEEGPADQVSISLGKCFVTGIHVISDGVSFTVQSFIFIQTDSFLDFVIITEVLTVGVSQTHGAHVVTARRAVDVNEALRVSIVRGPACECGDVVVAFFMQCVVVSNVADCVVVSHDQFDDDLAVGVVFNGLLHGLGLVNQTLACFLNQHIEVDREDNAFLFCLGDVVQGSILVQPRILAVAQVNCFTGHFSISCSYQFAVCPAVGCTDNLRVVVDVAQSCVSQQLRSTDLQVDAAVERSPESLAEVVIQQGSPCVGPQFFIIGIICQIELFTVHVEDDTEDCRVRQGFGCIAAVLLHVLVEVFPLGADRRSNVDTLFEGTDAGIRIGTIVIDTLDALQINMLGIPVVVILDQSDLGILVIGLEDETTVVQDGISCGCTEGAGALVRGTQLAAFTLGFQECPVDRIQDCICCHGIKVRCRGFKSIFDCIVVQGLDTDLLKFLIREIRVFIFCVVLDDAFHQPAGTGSEFRTMTQTGNEVISFHFIIFLTGAGNPLDTRAQVECPDCGILIVFPGFSQAGCQVAETVIFEQAVNEVGVVLMVFSQCCDQVVQLLNLIARVFDEIFCIRKLDGSGSDIRHVNFRFFCCFCCFFFSRFRSRGRTAGAGCQTQSHRCGK